MIPQRDSDRDPFDWLRLKHLAWRATEAPDMNDTYVAGEGENERPPVMLIGEAPGAEEVVRQRPFVGPSGQVLRQLMDVAGVTTGYAPHFGNANCWLTNVVKFRPPSNRTPSTSEIASVRELLHAEWQIIGKPRVIVPIGGVALAALVGSHPEGGILAHSGWVHTVRSTTDGEKLWVWPMLHPAFCLRNEKFRPIAEEDWTTFGRWLSNR